MKTNHRKAFLCVVALVLLCLTLCPAVLGAVPNHTNNFYVNDYADILSTETEQEIQNIAVSLANETTAQVCVLTIESLDGEDISEYSVEVFRQWGIGDEDKDNGVLILVSLQDREMWVTTGYGVEGTLTDTKLGQLRDAYAIPYYSEDNFDEGTLQLFGAIVNELRTEEYGLDSLQEYGSYEQSSGEFIDDGFFILFFAIMVATTTLPTIILFATRIRYNMLVRYDRMHGTQRAIAYQKKMKKIRKIIRSSNTHGNGRHHGGFRGGGLGGGFGGGGFGGGGFSGGGGSTGGGGAGGKF